jgi:hypothetical protein
MASRLPGFHQMYETEFSVRPASSFGDSFAASVAERQMSAAPLLTSSLGFPIYGNYCGPGHGDPTGSVAPVDRVDNVCRAHDLCYKNAGTPPGTLFGPCNCDRDLINNMPAAINHPNTGQQGKNAGTLVRNYFSQAPCTCPGPSTTTCLPPLCFGSLCLTFCFTGPPLGLGGNC